MIAMIAKQGLPRLIAAAGLAVALLVPLTAPSAAADDPPQNAVELRVSGVVHEPAGRYGQFTYTREFHDLSGRGAKIRHGRVCYSSGGCISAPLEYIVEPGGVLVQEGQLLMPMSISQAFDFTYVGEDGEGGDVTVKARILVVGDQLELQDLSNSERVVTRLGTADRRESNEADRRESDEANRRDSTMLRDDGAGDGINV